MRIAVELEQRELAKQTLKGYPPMSFELVKGAAGFGLRLDRHAVCEDVVGLAAAAVRFEPLSATFRCLGSTLVKNGEQTIFSIKSIVSGILWTEIGVLYQGPGCRYVGAGCERFGGRCGTRTFAFDTWCFYVTFWPSGWTFFGHCEDTGDLWG